MNQHHGGPDAQGPVRWDFSTNSNAAGPCPAVRAAVAAADATRYPDPGYHALRARLAAHHGVAVQRVLPAASASEFIQRITAVGARLQPGPVQVPALAYGDYARAARACGRTVQSEAAAAHDPPGRATLRWCCEPGSPLGQDAPAPADVGAIATVLDAVYAPLRLSGHATWSAADQDLAFVLHSPNKALGLAGVRAAYAIAPLDGPWRPWLDALNAAAPSWPLGAHGVALLHAWADAATQRWLAASLGLLRAWKVQQLQALAGRGIATEVSVSNFFCARLSADPAHLRRHGVQVRDTASFGRPGWVRLSVQPPAAQAALLQALIEAPMSAPMSAPTQPPPAPNPAA